MVNEGEPREVMVQTVTVNEQGVVAARSSHRSVFLVEDLGGVDLEMVLIPAGSFLMGSGPGEGYDDERPRHPVTVPAFLLGRYPITQSQWRAVMGTLPPVRSRGDRQPVDRVSYDDAMIFCERLSHRTGRAYRLPSEAEWEYACRAGTLAAFHYGPTINTDLANYVGEHTYRWGPAGVYRHGTTDVGTFPANSLGLHDMHGNVWEWCADTWHDDYRGAPMNGSSWAGREATDRVLRGGCWHDPPDLCRSAARLRQRPTEGEDFFGFRVALSNWSRREGHEDLPGPVSPSTVQERIAAWLSRRTSQERP